MQVWVDPDDNNQVAAIFIGVKIVGGYWEGQGCFAVELEVESPMGNVLNRLKRECRVVTDGFTISGVFPSVNKNQPEEEVLPNGGIAGMVSSMREARVVKAIGRTRPLQSLSRVGAATKRRIRTLRGDE